LNYISIQTQNLALVNNVQSEVHEGSSVFVRVIAENSPQNYTVSLAGSRISVKSDIPLKQGDSFTAIIKTSRDGKILLIPAEQNAPLQQFSRIESFLAAQGVSPDDSAVKLVALLQNLGVKIDPKIISKASVVSKKFPGKERKAAEIAAVLEEKGIPATEENVKRFLMELDFNSEGNQKESKSSYSQSDGSIIDKLYSSPLPQDEGLLAFFNHKKNDGPVQWLVLPYEYNLNEKNARGNIRIQYNNILKTTEKICVDVKFNSENSSQNKKKDVTNYYFVVYYKLSKVREMRFCTLPPLLTSRIPFEEKRLGELLRSGMSDDSVSVIYSTSAFTEGFFLNDEIPLSFEESV